MKRLLLNLTLGFATLGAFGQTVYQEDFNISDGGWTIESGTDWEWGVPTGSEINYDDSECGGSTWVTNLDGHYTNSSNSVDVSPTIDCSGLAEDPIISFDLYYITESCCDEGWMEFSLDNGSTWTKLLAGPAIGWYNDTFNDWWDGTNSGWTTVSNVIPGAAGINEVKLRFHFSSDGSVSREGFAFDNVLVSSDFESITMTGVTNIASGLVLGAAENIELSITNNTGADLSDIEVCYVLNDGAPVCETITTLTPGVNSYTFTATEDFSAEGTYTMFTYSEALEGDVNHCDDSTTVVAVLLQPVTEFPYVESFESPTAFLTTGTWEVGEPAVDGLFYNNLACSPDSMVLGTSIDGDYPHGVTDYAYTPFFDFSGFAEDPFVIFDLFRETETCCDEAWLEQTLDGGATWSKVGVSGSGLNWYNDAPNQWWDGNSDGWVYAYHELTGLAGVASVQFRFVLSTDGSIAREGIAIDNFTIQQEEPIIVQGVPLSLNLSTNYELCGFTTSDTIVAEFQNIGSDSLIGFTVCYDAGLGLVCETLTDTILPGETYTHTFEVPLDLTGEASHDITLTITSDLDFRVCEENLYSFNVATDVTSLVGTPTVTDITCNGETDGEVFVNPTEGTPGYSITWADGEVAFSLGSLAAGFHTYTITDANGCTLVDSAEVIEPAAIVLATTTTSETEPGNGEIDLTVTGGTAPYSFDWDNDGTGDFDAEDLTNLAPGTYTVIVTDANGCTETTTVTVSSVVGLEELGEQAFKVYPNPTNGTFQIALNNVEGNYAVNIYNMLGKVVYSSAITSQTTTIEAETLAKGAYLVEISNDTERNTIRLIVE